MAPSDTSSTASTLAGTIMRASAGKLADFRREERPVAATTTRPAAVRRRGSDSQSGESRPADPANFPESPRGLQLSVTLPVDNFRIVTVQISQLDFFPALTCEHLEESRNLPARSPRIATSGQRLRLLRFQDRLNRSQCGLRARIARAIVLARRYRQMTDQGSNQLRRMNGYLPDGLTDDAQGPPRTHRFGGIGRGDPIEQVGQQQIVAPSRLQHCASWFR